jgi:hypothetical protein
MTISRPPGQNEKKFVKNRNPAMKAIGQKENIKTKMRQFTADEFLTAIGLLIAVAEYVQ